MSTRVARTAAGLAHRNTLNLRKVKIFLQRFPGKHGTDADRGIADVEFVVRVDGRVVDKGKTGADGLINVLAPAGRAVEVEALGTKYDVKLVNRIEAKTAIKGQQQRLFLLGYEPGAADGTLRKETDLAAIEFQVDTTLYPSGSLGNTGIDATTQNKLASEFGE
jgi:hypothetical protein